VQEQLWIVRWPEIERANMNVAGNSEMMEKTNILPLFLSMEATVSDPIQELLIEAEAEAWECEALVVNEERLLVTENQFPDQSLFILEQQLENLNQSMGRLRFYLSDLSDLLPG